MRWLIEESGYNKEKDALYGNKFLVGNGYLGIRGTLQEHTKEELTAVNLSGIYDQVGDGWREPLNAPNGLYTYIEMDGVVYKLQDKDALSHRMGLDYRYGIHFRDTTWDTPRGKIRVVAERFVCLHEKHLIAMRYEIQAEFSGSIKLITGIDGDVWDIHGPHYKEIEKSSDDDLITAIGITQEAEEKVCVCEGYYFSDPFKEEMVMEEKKVLRNIKFNVKPKRKITLFKYISVYTSKDTLDFHSEARELVKKARELGYDTILENHKVEWDNLWDISEVKIEGDDDAMTALNYSIYHLHCIAPRHRNDLSIPARGLSGQTYKGAVFWDTEMFMLEFFLSTEPEVAKTLLRYRIHTLEGAKRKARSYGYKGAFYPWESQEEGIDACSDYNVVDVFTGRRMRTYFRDKQIHISSAIVYGMMKYTEFTGDLGILKEGGAEVIIECALFYYDCLIKRVNGNKYEVHDVVGPDEYHERVNNNVYTNRMIQYTFDSAIKALGHCQEKLKNIYDTYALVNQFRDASEKLYIPEPDKKNQVIEQFDGYHLLEDVELEELRKRLLDDKEYWGGAYGIASQTKVIKQADVVSMLYLFSDEYSTETLMSNWNYYEPRTEHGSSLSACMYGILACKCNMPDKAYPFFIKSATADLVGGGKEWAGLVYIGGTHPASAGGAYKIVIEGFAGLYHEDGILKIKPALPLTWQRLSFKIVYRKEVYQIDITKNKSMIQKL